MEKILVVAEKPSVGRDLARILGCKQKKEGYFEGNKHVVTWCIGHLVTLFEPEDYDTGLKKWSIHTLPIIPEEMKLKVVGRVEKQFEIIKMLMNSTKISSLICATDAGREGELIFRYIYQLAGCTKPFGRLWISSMVDSAVKEGFRKIKPGHEYNYLFESARCRSEADWLVGINATRAFTVRHGNLLSVGRVQTPTLAILVQRQKEIDNFVPRDYWEIRADYGDFSGLWYDRENEENRTYIEKKAEEIAAKVKGKTGIIKEIREEAKKELPPLLYDLNELQRDANKRFGFSAKKTLGLAQDLYEKHKMITYPRTDSRYLTKDMIPGLKPLISKVGESRPALREYAGYLTNQPELPVTKRIVDDRKVSDHHAIIPTGKSAKLPPDADKVFGLVATRLLAAFYPEHQYTLTTITVEVEDEHFISKGRTIRQEGWKALYKNTDRKKKKEEDEQTLPPVQKDDPVEVKGIEVIQKQTKPPAPYTEAGLLSAMEHAGRFVEDGELKEHLKERGLGTPATRAGIIERLIQVGYLERQGKKLIPTDKGINLIKVVPQQLKSPEMTGEWEQGLNHISAGKLSPDEFMSDIRRYVRYVVDEASKFELEAFSGQQKRAANSGEKGEDDVLGECPSCQKGKVVGNAKGYGCERWRDGCKFFIASKILGKKLQPEQVKQLISTGKTEMIQGFTSKKGKQFNARLAFQDGKLRFIFK